MHNTRDKQREKKIAQMYVDGVKVKDIAAAFNINVQRLYQIMNRMEMGRRCPRKASKPLEMLPTLKIIADEAAG